jgi:hypothetical protein
MPNLRGLAGDLVGVDRFAELIELLLDALLRDRAGPLEAEKLLDAGSIRAVEAAVEKARPDVFVELFKFSPLIRTVQLLSLRIWGLKDCLELLSSGSSSSSSS